MQCFHSTCPSFAAWPARRVPPISSTPSRPGFPASWPAHCSVMLSTLRQFPDAHIAVVEALRALESKELL
ncbi:MAG: hypothetical protein HYZ37_07480 [Candidatus Solibacter usitatus]|nr:hypothetical protein [Candidatus Solibacter usitatus]